MRDVVIQTITEAARQDRDIMFLSADFGAPALDEFRRDLPDQFVHTGIAEQHMIDLAAGLALSGKKVFCYAMAPFITTRCYEQIKCSLGAMNLPVTLIGVGVGLGYDNTSMTHICIEDIACMRAINNLQILTPSDNETARACAQLALEKPALRYLRLERHTLPDLYSPVEAKVCVRALGFAHHLVGLRAEVGIIACGGMTHVALEAARELQSATGFGLEVVDLISVKPFPELNVLLKNARIIITVEEQLLMGGMGSAVLEALTPRYGEIIRLGIKDGFKLINGDREALRRHFHIDKDSIVQTLTVD